MRTIALVGSALACLAAAVAILSPTLLVDPPELGGRPEGLPRLPPPPRSSTSSLGEHVRSIREGN